MTDAAASAVFNDYVKAVEEKDWPSQAGILVSLLRMCVLTPETPTGKIAVSTAKSILMYREVKKK